MDSAPGVPIGSAVDVPASIGRRVTVRLEAGVSLAGVSVAGGVDRSVAVEVEVAMRVGSAVDVPVIIEAVVMVTVGARVGVSVTTGVKSEGEVRVSWAAQVALLPRSISMPTSNRETISQQRSNGLAFMLSPLGCKAKLKVSPG